MAGGIVEKKAREGSKASRYMEREVNPREFFQWTQYNKENGTLRMWRDVAKEVTNSPCQALSSSIISFG